MKRSKFSLSHYKLLTCDMGELVPVGLMEVLPGDTIQQATSMLVRVSPLVAPVMHPVHVRIHHWFVPFRLIWDGWEDFITGGPDGDDDQVWPYVRLVGNTVVGGLYDYLGVPPGAAGTGGINVSALPARAYQTIWNEWYRDQDLQPEVIVSKASSQDVTTGSAMQHVSWEKDYFTSARPWTQKGPEVTVPMGTTAPVVASGDGQPIFERVPGETSGLNFAAAGTNTWMTDATPAHSAGRVGWSQTKLQADLANATAANINELRTAFALQRYAEARARYGSRYTEYLRYLGVKSSDARLQRPEYLGGGKQTIQFSEVLQTGPGASGTSVVGDLKGHGIGAMRSNRYRRFFEEHGLVLSLLSVKPRTMYVQGMDRLWFRGSKEVYFQKELQHVGQQEVYEREVYALSATPNAVFGYQDRYDEYRRMESRVHGEFRTTLDYWHYGRIFTGDPVLNASFVKCDATKRPNAVQTNDVLWIMCNHSIQARRMVDGSARSYIL